MADCFETQSVLGAKNVYPSELFELIQDHLSLPVKVLAENKASHNLDDYIEAQIHDDLSLEKDVYALFADSSFQGTKIEKQMVALCKQYNIELIWYNGLALGVEDVPNNFRGPEMPALASFISEGKDINAYLIGLAAKDVVLNPDHWKEWGNEKECLQKLKLLWHVLLKFGKQ